MKREQGGRNHAQRRSLQRAPIDAASIIMAIAFADGCVGYTPKPLNDQAVEAVLASPDRAVLVKRAGELSNPALPKTPLDFSKPLTLDEISIIAVLTNPDLRALRAQQRVAAAQVFAAGLLADPQLTLGLDRLMAPSGQGFVNAYAGSLSFDLLGALATREIAQAGARSAAEQVRLDIAWAELNTAAQARLLVLRLHYQVEMAELAHTASDAAGYQLQRTLVASSNGDLKGDEVEARRIAASDAEARALAAERDASATRLDLNHLLGLQPEEHLDLAPIDAPEPWRSADAELLFAMARDRRLDLQALAAGYRSQEAAVHRAVLGQYPRLSITLNRARDTSRVHTFGPAITFDIPLWNRNRGAIATADADRDRLQQEYAARLHQTRADIAALVAALDLDETARRTAKQQLDGVHLIADAMQAAAERGDLTRPVAESARASEVDKRLALLSLEQSCAEQRLALSLAAGQTFSDSPAQP